VARGSGPARRGARAKYCRGKYGHDPQAQPTVLNGGLEEMGEEVASPSARAATGGLEMKDAPPESPKIRKEEAPSPLVQEGGQEEAKKPKRSDE
jgi:hypothetical protein